MPTVPELKARVAAYLQKAPADLIVNEVDLCLIAINKAHQGAQMKRDFEFSKVPVLYTINLSTGGVLSPASMLDDTLVTVKKMLQPWTTVDSTGRRARPIHFETRQTQKRELAQDWANRPWDYRFTDPPLAVSNTAILPAVYQIGDTLFLYPADNSTWGATAETVLIAADVVRWLPDLADNNNSNDFLLQFGDCYLQWDAIYELNKLVKEFVPQEQGNLDDKYILSMREDAWDELLTWDASVVAEQELTLD